MLCGLFNRRSAYFSVRIPPRVSGKPPALRLFLTQNVAIRGNIRRGGHDSIQTGPRTVLRGELQR